MILREATLTDAELFEFYAGTSDTEFLFGSDVVAYLERIRKRALDMRLYQELFEPMPVGDERSRHVQANHDELLWLTNQTKDITNVFLPYIGFSHIT